MLYSRIDKLDYQLRSLQAQHQVAETENLKRSNLLEQTTMALSLLENENTKLQKVTRYILASLDSDKAVHFVGPDLGQNYLHRL